MRLTFPARHVHWLLLAVVSIVPARAQAQQQIANSPIQVDCNRKQGPNRTIQGTLNSLDPLKSHTLVVSGTCNENVLIQGFERLTLIAKPGASIDDASGGTNDVVTIFDASRVSMRGFIVNGGADCVVCQDASLCQFSGNTFQNGGTGANIFRAQAKFIGDVFQSNGTGLFLFATADVWGIGVTVQGNQGPGAHVGLGSSLRLVRDQITGVGSVVQNNLAAGIEVTNNSTTNFESATIRGNGGAGVKLSSSSVAQFGSVEGGSGDTITGNADAGVDVGDLSFASFLPNVGNNITGNLLANSTKDVFCRPQFSATRGALTNIGGGTTNCLEPGNSQ